jgi:hypothetical protein
MMRTACLSDLLLLEIKTLAAQLNYSLRTSFPLTMSFLQPQIHGWSVALLYLRNIDFSPKIPRSKINEYASRSKNLSYVRKIYSGKVWLRSFYQQQVSHWQYALKKTSYNALSHHTGETADCNTVKGNETAVLFTYQMTVINLLPSCLYSIRLICEEQFFEIGNSYSGNA